MKKKILGLVIFLIGIVPTFAADVAPLSFTYISQPDTQQAEWDYLMKYKLFGATGIRFKNQKIQIPDSSGWFGTAEGDFLMKGDGGPSNGDILVGGPILIGGNVSLDLGPDVFTSGPVRVTGNMEAPAEGFKDKENVFAGPQCVKGTTDSKYEAFVPAGNRYFGTNYGSCPTKVPEIRTRLRIPNLTGNHTYQSAIHVNNTTAYIDVPEGDGLYDLYIEKISAQNEGRIYVRMPKGGRLTRIFLRDGIDLGSAHPKLQIQYKQDDGTYQTVTNKDYSGNLLFYTDKDISFASFLRTDSIQGTFITSGQISIAHHLTLAGQLLANYILIDTDFDGSGFRYVPFDPPILNIEPQAGTRLEFPENNDLVKVPIALDTAAPVNVYFDYCFDLGNSTAQLSDIYMEDGFLYPKTAGYSFPVCGSSVGKVVINEHMTTPSDKPDESVWINVKRDYAVEGDEPLRLRIMNLTGAVLPGNKHDGYFDLILIDSDIEPKSADFAVTATEDVLFTFESSKFEYSSAFDKAEKGIVIKTLPDKGSLLYNADTLKAATFPNEGLFIPLSSLVNEELKFVGAKNDYGVNPAYTSFKFVVVDEDSILSKAPYTATVAVSPVNDAPTVTAGALEFGEVDHQLKSGTIVGSDIENDALTYSFDNKFDATYTEANYNKITSLYTMDPATGVVSVKSGVTLNYESLDSVLTIRVKVVDDAANSNGVGKDSAYAVVVLKIVDQNEAPIVRDTTFSVEENSPAGTVVGQLKASDPDIRSDVFGKLTYSIVETNVPFSIEQDGTISVSQDNALDFETKPSWTIHVKVTDGFIPQTVEVTINLIDVNEPPHIDDIQDEYNVVENTANATVFASIKITDQDAADDKDAFTVTLTDLSTTSGVTASQLFKATVVENDDHSLRIVITVDDSEKLDYEALLKNGASDVYYDVRLTLTDHNDNGTQNTVTADTRIYVTDENEKPTAKDGNFTIPENSPANTFVGKVEASDPDTANATFGTLYYSFVETTNQFVINNTTGEIRVKSGAVLDYETTPNHKITLHVNVTDNQYTETATVVVTLTDVNEKPEIIDDGKDYEVVENTAAGTEIARYEIKDVDAADANFATSLVVSLTDDASHTIKAQSLFETVVKTEGGKTYAVLQVKSEPNFEDILNKNLDSLFNVTITLKDQKGVSGCNTVTLPKKITVRDINEAPMIGETPIYTVKENSTQGTAVGKVDAYDEDTWSELTFELVNIPGEDDVASLFNIDNNGNITVAANANLDYETKNEYRVTVRVTDNGATRKFNNVPFENLSAETVITIQVLDDDEKPGFDDKYPTFSVYENSKAGTNVGTVTATDDDCKDNTCAALTYTLIADTVAANANDYKEFKIDAATGKITVAKDSTLNYEVDNLYYALVVVDDGTLTDTARVTINIKDANDRPVIKNKTLTVPENSTAGTVVGKVPATDEDTWSKLA
ncbi:MAG: cadherin domain-containing protein, partial [Bacteroidales bacterium]|nr:cadherin domain-containing protein [Bacteroidales bacterium]